MNRILVGQFTWRSLIGCLLVAGGLSVSGNLRMVGSALLGGGWMLANCATLTGVSVSVLRSRQAYAWRAVTMFLGAIFGMFAVGWGLVAVLRPPVLGLTAGLFVVLGVFVYQLRQLALRIRADAP